MAALERMAGQAKGSMNTAPQPHEAVQQRIDSLAEDVGRLRRRIEPGSSLEHQADRIAGHVVDLYWMLHHTAAELVAWYDRCNDEAIDEAIQDVDNQDHNLRRKLGLRRKPGDPA